MATFHLIHALFRRRVLSSGLVSSSVGRLKLDLTPEDMERGTWGHAPLR